MTKIKNIFLIIKIFARFLVFNLIKLLKEICKTFVKFVIKILNCFSYLRDLYKFTLQSHAANFHFLPCLSDKLKTTPFDAHYTYQGRWAMEKILQSNVTRHVDIGSQVDFIAYLSLLVKVEHIDIRPLKANFKNFLATKGSIINLPFSDNSIKSLSCLHVFEHIGLGRYGDPVDFSAFLEAAKEMQRVLASGGKLYLSVPVGKEAIVFNAHRIFNPRSIVKLFKRCKLVEVAAVYDNGDFKENVSLNSLDEQNYACGMFMLEKI